MGESVFISEFYLLQTIPTQPVTIAHPPPASPCCMHPLLRTAKITRNYRVITEKIAAIRGVRAGAGLIGEV